MEYTLIITCNAIKKQDSHFRCKVATQFLNVLSEIKLVPHFYWCQVNCCRGGSRTAETLNMEHFVIIVNYYHKELHLAVILDPPISNILPPSSPWTSIFKRTPPPSPNANQSIKRKHNPRMTIYVIRSFLQVGFPFLVSIN